MKTHSRSKLSRRKTHRKKPSRSKTKNKTGRNSDHQDQDEDTKKNKTGRNSGHQDQDEDTTKNKTGRNSGHQDQDEDTKKNKTGRNSGHQDQDEDTKKNKTGRNSGHQDQDEDTTKNKTGRNSGHQDQDEDTKKNKTGRNSGHQDQDEDTTKKQCDNIKTSDLLTSATTNRETENKELGNLQTQNDFIPLCETPRFLKECEDLEWSEENVYKVFGLGPDDTKEGERSSYDDDESKDECDVMKILKFIYGPRNDLETKGGSYAAKFEPSDSEKPNMNVRFPPVEKTIPCGENYGHVNSKRNIKKGNKRSGDTNTYPGTEKKTPVVLLERLEMNKPERGINTCVKKKVRNKRSKRCRWTKRPKNREKNRLQHVSYSIESTGDIVTNKDSNKICPEYSSFNNPNFSVIPKWSSNYKKNQTNYNITVPQNNQDVLVHEVRNRKNSNILSKAIKERKHIERTLPQNHELVSSFGKKYLVNSPLATPEFKHPSCSANNQSSREGLTSQDKSKFATKRDYCVHMDETQNKYCHFSIKNNVKRKEKASQEVNAAEKPYSVNKQNHTNIQNRERNKAVRKGPTFTNSTVKPTHYYRYNNFPVISSTYIMVQSADSQEFFINPVDNATNARLSTSTRLTQFHGNVSSINAREHMCQFKVTPQVEDANGRRVNQSKFQELSRENLGNAFTNNQFLNNIFTPSNEPNLLLAQNNFLESTNISRFLMNCKDFNNLSCTPNYLENGRPISIFSCNYSQHASPNHTYQSAPNQGSMIHSNVLNNFPSYSEKEHNVVTSHSQHPQPSHLCPHRPCSFNVAPMDNSYNSSRASSYSVSFDNSSAYHCEKSPLNAPSGNVQSCAYKENSKVSAGVLNLSSHYFGSWTSPSNYVIHYTSSRELNT